MTTRQAIADWLTEAVNEGADFMIVVCDTFEYDDYPVSVSREEFWEKYDHFNGRNMQRIMEVYDLSMDLRGQLSERRARHCPPREGSACL